MVLLSLKDRMKKLIHIKLSREKKRDRYCNSQILLQHKGTQSETNLTAGKKKLGAKAGIRIYLLNNCVSSLTWSRGADWRGRKQQNTNFSHYCSGIVIFFISLKNNSWFYFKPQAGKNR